MENDLKQTHIILTELLISWDNNQDSFDNALKNFLNQLIYANENHYKTIIEERLKNGNFKNL